VLSPGGAGRPKILTSPDATAIRALAQLERDAVERASRAVERLHDVDDF